MFVVFRHVVWLNISQEANIIIGMKFGHFILSGLVWSLYNRKEFNSINSFNGATSQCHLRKSPFCDTIHSSIINYVSYECDVVSLDAPGHNNNFQYRLQYKNNNKQKLFKKRKKKIKKKYCIKHFQRLQWLAIFLNYKARKFSAHSFHTAHHSFGRPYKSNVLSSIRTHTNSQPKNPNGALTSTVRHTSDIQMKNADCRVNYGRPNSLCRNTVAIK